MSSANQWYISFLANRAVEFKRAIPSGSQVDGYAVRIGRICTNDIANGLLYRLHAFFYDLATSQMFGKPSYTGWKRAVENCCSFDEELFFHCPIIDDKLLLIIEFVEKNELTDVTKSIGWCKSSIQVKNETIINYTSSHIHLQKSDVYYGTPKVLIFGDNVELKIAGNVEIQVFSHVKLLEVVNYFPEFCIINANDSIPGLISFKNDPQLRNPKKEALVSASLDDVSVIFGPDSGKIENNIINEMIRDRQLKENLPPNSITNAKIVERRLKVGVHNGYCYLSEPLSINLTLSDVILLSNNSTLKKRRALSSNDIRNGSISMFVNSKISIPNIFEDDRIALVFMIEYTFLYEFDNRITHPILIAWGAWKPFASDENIDLLHQRSINSTVSLVGGPRPNPEGLLCFRNLLNLTKTDDNVFTESQPQITLSFNFFLDQLNIESRMSEAPILHTSTPKTDRSSRSHRLKNQPSNKDNIQNNLETIEKFPSIDSARSITSREDLQSINRDLEECMKVEESSDIMEHPNSCLKDDTKEENIERHEAEAVYRVPLEESKPINFPRSVHALFAQQNFQSLKDRHGDLPTIHDVNDNKLINLSNEKNDRLDVSHIFFQFIAYKRLSFTDSYNTHKVFFTINFYRFQELNTESLLLTNSSNNSSEPSILRRIDKNGKLLENAEPGFIAKYIIESEEDKSDFVDYLANGNAVIDVWDSESLMHMGSSIIPLKSLLRFGQEAAQVFIQCPVVNVSYGSNINKHSSLLYLRIANIGYPTARVYESASSISNTSCVIRKMSSSTYQKLSSEEGPHSYRILAKPLNLANKSSLERFLAAQRLDIQQRHEEIFNRNNSIETEEKINKLRNSFSFERNSIKTLSQKYIFEEELAAYRKLRYESKPAKLLEAVFKGITIRHEIRVSFGEKLFFEFPLENCSSEPINCIMELDDQALSPIFDIDEWKFYKKSNDISTKLERNMMRQVDNHIEIFMKPGETLFIPFLYDSFYFTNDRFDMYATKVIFRRWDNKEPMSILDLHIYRRDQLINHSVVFITESAHNFHKQLIVPKIKNGKRIVSCRCSDPEVKIAIRQSVQQQIIAFSTFTNHVGSRKTIYILMYSDHYQSRLLSTWKVTLYSFQRVDIRSIVGQTTHTVLAIPQNRNQDDEVNDVFCAYTSSKCFKTEKSILSGGERTVAVDFVPSIPGTQNHLLTVVNKNTQKLEYGFLVICHAQSPKISQKFCVNVPINPETMLKKNVDIQNPYGIARTFRISSSRPDCVKVGDHYINIPPLSSQPCHLYFSPISHKPLNVETLLFITNAENNQQEEAYSIMVKYV